MIPVYERGEYMLKLLPPPGWSFEPSQIELNVDGETDPCTLNQDLNFVFKGFGLAGRVCRLPEKPFLLFGDWFRLSVQVVRVVPEVDQPVSH